jgi:hypothetical protein
MDFPNKRTPDGANIGNMHLLKRLKMGDYPVLLLGERVLRNGCTTIEFENGSNY